MLDATVPLFPAGGIPGGTELIVILLIAVLLFGANKIPKLARSTGQAMGEFQKGREQVEQELEEMKGEGEGEAEAETETASGTESTTDSDGTDSATSTSDTGSSTDAETDTETTTSSDKT